MSVIKPVIRPFHSQPLVSCRLDCLCVCPCDTQETVSAMGYRWYHANLSDWRSLTMLNAVGIDVSKGKSTVSVLQPGGTVLKRPFDVVHSSSSLNNLSRFIQHLDGETRVVMECTGRYHEPILHSLHDAGIFGSAVNPHLIKNFCNNTLRKVNRILLIPGKLSAMLLTTGLLYGNIQLWILPAHNLKPLIHRWTFLQSRKSLPGQI